MSYGPWAAEGAESLFSRVNLRTHSDTFPHRLERYGLWFDKRWPFDYVFQSSNQTKETEWIMLQMDAMRQPEPFRGDPNLWYFSGYKDPELGVSTPEPDTKSDRVMRYLYKGRSMTDYDWEEGEEEEEDWVLYQMQQNADPLPSARFPGQNKWHFGGYTPSYLRPGQNTQPSYTAWRRAADSWLADNLVQYADVIGPLKGINSPPKPSSPTLDPNIPTIDVGVQMHPKTPQKPVYRFDAPPHTGEQYDYTKDILDLEQKLQQMKKQQSMAGTHEQTGGIGIPGTHYIGPGSKVPGPKPTSKLDEIALHHDLGYEQLLAHGEWPYINYNYYDEKMIQEIKSNADVIQREGDSWLANFIVGLWTAKQRITEPIYELVKHVTPPDPLAEKSLYRLQHALGQQLPVTHWTPQTDRPPARIADKRPASPASAGDRPNKMSCLTPTKLVTSTSDDDMGECQAQPDHINQAGMPTATTDSAQGLIGPQGDDVCAGGGGGSQRCNTNWVGGIKWFHNRFITYNTRRVILQPFNNKYVATTSVDSNPGVDISTPWYYIDLNCFYSHINPATMQEILETTDGFRPRKLHIKLTEVVGKDVTCSGTESPTTTVTDSQTATILVHADDGYYLPYVMGGGQETVPEHIQGDWYKLPQYAYRTVGSEHPMTTSSNPSFRPDAGGAQLDNRTPRIDWQSIQDSEFFMLENLPSIQLHPGCDWSHTYHFPRLDWAYTTQYPWDLRRSDNPYQKQRIVVPKSCFQKPADKEQQPTGPYIDVDNIADNRGMFKKPTMWLPANRHRDGDCIIIPKDKVDASLHKAPIRNATPPTILVRQTLFGFDDNVNYTNNNTEQPGPSTEDKAIRTPGGTMVITSNALTIKRKIEKLQEPYEPHKGHYANVDTHKRYLQLVIQNERGVGGPAEPDHVRERCLSSCSTGSRLLNYPLFQEITYGMHTGAPIERESGFYEAQIWQRNPNTDAYRGGSHPPLAQWAMPNPPPMILLRMLPMPCNPPFYKCTKTPRMKALINSYVTMQIQYEMTWEFIPRQRQRARWNPMTPTQLPPPLPGRHLIYNLDTNSSFDTNQYVIAQESWNFKGRMRLKRWTWLFCVVVGVIYVVVEAK
nr:structural protein [Bovine copiparvovirus 3]